MSKPTTRELLEARKAELEADIAKIEAKAAPIREHREKLREEMAPMEAELIRMNNAIKELEQPELSNLKNELAAVARGLGSKSIKVAPATVKAGE